MADSEYKLKAAADFDFNSIIFHIGLNSPIEINILLLADLF